MTPHHPHRLTLASGEAGGHFRVVAVHGGAALKQRLAAMGLSEGKTLVKLGRQLFNGPVTVRIAHTELALGHSTAGHVEVEPTKPTGDHPQSHSGRGAIGF